MSACVSKCCLSRVVVALLLKHKLMMILQNLLCVCVCAQSGWSSHIKLCSEQLDQLSAFYKVKTSAFCLTGPIAQTHAHTRSGILSIFVSVHPSVCVSFFPLRHTRPNSLCHLNSSLPFSLSDTHTHTLKHTHLSSVFPLTSPLSRLSLTSVCLPRVIHLTRHSCLLVSSLLMEDGLSSISTASLF